MCVEHHGMSDEDLEIEDIEDRDNLQCEICDCAINSAANLFKVFKENLAKEKDFDPDTYQFEIEHEKPIRVGDNKVTFHRDGSIDVGCEKITTDQIKKIVRRSQEVRSQYLKKISQG